MLVTRKVNSRKLIQIWRMLIFLDSHFLNFHPQNRSKLTIWISVSITQFLKSFIYWGIDCFSKFNGMFAAAIYDKLRKKIYLCRDIAGEKPLYYYIKNQTFAFASEAKAFYKNLELTKNKDTSFFDSFQHCLKKTLWNEESLV